MAQYGKNFYGSSYYGTMTAFSSTYTSKIFDAEEPFTGPISIELSGQKPVRAYGRADKEVQPNGNWTGTTDYRTTDIGAELIMRLSTSDVRMVYKTQNIGDQFIEMKVTKTDGTVLFQQNVNTLGSGVDATFGTSFPYQEVTVSMKTVSTTSATPFIIRRLNTIVTDFTFEIGFGSTKTNIVFQPVALTGTSVFTGSSTTVTNKRYVQFKIHLASSDDGVTPIVEYVKLNSLDTQSRATNGYWTASLNMTNVAQAAGVTFSKVTSFDWTETKPEGTDLGIRSRAAATAGSTTFGPETALYRKGYTRLRLPDDRTEAYLITKKPIDPREFLGNQFNVIKEWGAVQSVLSFPPDEVGQDIEYEFYDVYPDETNAGIVPIATVHPFTEDVSRVMSLFNEKNNKLFYLVIRLKRLSTKATPVVDWVSLSSNMEFKQIVSRTTDNLSAVDNGTGTKDLWKLNGSEFSWPTNTNGNALNQSLLSAASKSLDIIDETSRVGIQLYFKSKVSQTQGRNVTTTMTDTIVGKAEATDAPASSVNVDVNKLYFHYHYNGSTVQYLIKDEHQMGSDYTPSLLRNKKYRYVIKNGWPVNRIRLSEPLTWEQLAEQLNVDVTKLKELNPNKLVYENKLVVGQEIVEPNESLNARVTVSFKDKGSVTDVSSHNDNGNSIVSAELTNGDYGFTEWVSEEKIYTGYLNLNDIREMYVRQQPNGSLNVAESDYRVLPGDTYEKIATKKKIHVTDLRKANQEKELVSGEMIRIPSPLTLPFLAPNVLFQDADGMANLKPYEITIVENSVRKKDGTVLDEAVIIPPGVGRLPLDYTMVESAPIAVKITRGNVANGRDLLQHKNVRRVISIKDSNSVTYTPYTEIGGIKTGDFVLDGNYIWWKGQQQTSKEPAAALEYTVTYTYDDIKDVIITLDSRYQEKAGYDVLWRSPEVKEYQGIATPLNDFKMKIDDPELFEGFNETIADAGYVVEDNDLWVKTYVVEEADGFYLVGTLDGEDPTKNWYPQIKSGYYYLQDQEYYMYAEPIQNVFAKEDVPIAKNAVTKDGKLYLNKDTTNYFTNSTMNTKEKKRIYSFTGEASLTWDQIDAQAKTWNQIDAEGKTWEEL